MLLAVLALAAILAAQSPSVQSPSVQTDDARARQLYVSTDPADHARGYDFERDVKSKADIDRRYAEASKGVMDFQKVTYRSSVGDLDIPAYLFQPLQRRGARGHAAMVWVHGGVHGNWGISMFPFVREAVERGYVVICPEYRGSTGYGEKHHNAIDYGGYEVDDVMSAVGYLKTLSHVDEARLGIMGWSHGGYITLFSVFRDKTPFKAAAAMVPVTNLVFRLSYNGPRYQRQFATQSRIQGLPFEKPAIYIERSPLYHVDKLNTPLLVHVATNDTDVRFRRGSADRRRPEVAQTGSRGNQGLCRSHAWTRERRPYLQPPHQPENTRTRRFARAARLLEPHVDVLRVALAAVRG